MPFTACPMAVAHAPCERVWALLAMPVAYDQWWDATTTRVDPPGAARPGQRVEFSARELGRAWKAHLTVEEADGAAHVLRFRATFPLGIRLHGRIACHPLPTGDCRVEFG